MPTSFDWAATKALIRQTVHDVLQVDATVVVAPGDAPQAVTVRWHDKINRFGNLENAGWAQVVEGIDRLIFNKPELTSKAIVLTSNSVITLLSGGDKFQLDVKEPPQGPVEEIWVVMRIT
jgi:hypothetical protein